MVGMAAALSVAPGLAGAELGEHRVGYISQDGMRHQVSLADAQAMRFEVMSPARRFAARKGQRHLTRLQIGGMLVQLAGEIRDALARPGSVVTAVGQPLAEVSDPFVLEVHRPVQPEDAPPGLPVLPPYVPRDHDGALGQVVRAAAGGRSGVAVLVAGSSTGKTRACWEALALLRGPEPPVAAVASDRPIPARCGTAGAGGHRAADRGVAERGPQFYLDTAGAGLGERAAAGLRELLRDPGRARCWCWPPCGPGSGTP
jgi:hypothetical protein